MKTTDNCRPRLPAGRRADRRHARRAANSASARRPLGALNLFNPRAFAVAAGLTAAAAFVWTARPHATAGVTAGYEAGEERPGGTATSRKPGRNRNAFSHPSGNLGLEDEFTFRLGNGLFRKLWVSSPASTRSSDGLGPHFNARACQRCHIKDGRGHPPASADDNFVSMLFRVGVPPSTPEQRAALASHRTNTFPEPAYGGQIQDFAVQGHRAEARPEVRYEEIPVKLNGGETVSLRKPFYSFRKLAFGAMSPETMISPRIANPMIGLGLLEAIPEEAVRKLADPDDSDADGVSGRPNLVWGVREKRVMLGRFGWKAGQPTVLQQSGAAFLGDIGLSTTVFPDSAGDCTQSQARCLNAPHGADPEKGNVEVTDQMLDLVAFYARNLAVPERPDALAPDVLAGKALFRSAGCAACHAPKFVTGNGSDIPKAQRNQTIWPYTDLLLHDMGPGLADGFTEGVANGREWRTAPLWGIGHTAGVNGHTFFLHDGRARNLLEAILWHGGEAGTARKNVVDMTPDQRRQLVAFLDSL